MNATLLMIIGLSMHIAMILAFVWIISKKTPLALSHATVILAFSILFVFEYEICREVMRMYGFPQPITARRLRWIQWVWYTTGVLHREILYYVAQARQKSRKT